MKHVSITFTKQDSSIPWYWEVNNLATMDQFIDNNADKIERSSLRIDDNTETTTLIFSDEQAYQEFQQFIDADIKNDYFQYCVDHNITIDTVTEDI
jgi:hypothetical protein